MNNITNARIFNTNLIDGPMRFKHYLEENYGNVPKRKQTDWLESEVKKEFLGNRIKAGLKYGFNGKKIIVPYDNDEYPKGHYFVADETIYNKDDDLWNVDIPADIVLLKKDNPGIVVAYPVSDDPVVIIEDQENGALALTHCDINKINNRIPAHAITALEKEVGSNVKNLKVYIGPNLKKENNISYLFKPKNIKKHKNIWENCIERETKIIIEPKIYQKYQKQLKTAENLKNKLSIVSKILKESKEFTQNSGTQSPKFYHIYQINEEQAIKNILLKRGIQEENITINQADTFSSVGYYSTANYETGNEAAFGKFLVGAYYEDTFPDYDGSYNTRKL